VTRKTERKRTQEARRPVGAPKRRGRPREAGRAATDAERAAEALDERHLIKRYGNRRLYDAKLSRAVTMEEIAEFVRRGEDVKVVDVDSGADVTRRVLLQILVDDKGGGMIDMLPVGLLHAMIAMRNDELNNWLQQYLAEGARWLEVQLAAARQFGSVFPWTGGPERPKEPPRPSTAEGAAGEGEQASARKGDERKSDERKADERKGEGRKSGALRAELDELWRRLGELRR